MALKFYTKSPDLLLSNFKAAIKKGNSEGGISTWFSKPEGFGHSAQQLNGKGLMQASVNTETERPYLQFTYVKGDGVISTYAFRELHGNLLSTFIEHFSSQFTYANYIDRRK